MDHVGEGDARLISVYHCAVGKGRQRLVGSWLESGRFCVGSFDPKADQSPLRLATYYCLVRATAFISRGAFHGDLGFNRLASAAGNAPKQAHRLDAAMIGYLC